VEFTYKPNITNDELNALPLHYFEGEVVLIDTLEQINQSIEELNNAPQIGFDTETRPSFKKGKINTVALLQLSTPEKAYLFRINKIGLPSEIISILEDKNITKIGVAIRDDLKNLKKVKNFNPEGFVDLQNYVKQFGIEDNGLRKLTGIVLNFRMSKAKQLSNWEDNHLSELQQIYAATDAWACVQIYNILNENS